MQIYFRAILTIAILAVILGSTIDIFYPNLECNDNNFGLLLSILTSFSLLENTEALFKIRNSTISKNQESESSGELAPIHGLRFLLIMWVITCHTTNFAPLGLYDQPMIACMSFELFSIIQNNFYCKFM